MAEDPKPRSIRVERKIIGPRPPRPRTVVEKRPRDYPGVAKAHLEVAAHLASPLLIGPPLCDELVAFVCHLYSEDEAAVVRHLSGLRAKTAAEVAAAPGLRPEQVEPILERLAFERHSIGAEGRGAERRYRLLPVVPGIFEMVLVGEDPEALDPWHVRFIELFEALFETGYLSDYDQGRLSPVRFLPASDAVAGHPLALPSDKLEVVLGRFDTFAIGTCQCRMAMRVTGRGCRGTLANCMAMGRWARNAIEIGQMREVSRQTALEIKLAAEREGLVNWIINVESTQGQVCCSCCGCCCHGLRMVNEQSVPASFAPPHFLPAIDREKCSFCGDCAARCPLSALEVDAKRRQIRHRPERCIGCGQCAVACEKRKAIALEPVPDYRLPPASWFAAIAGAAPGAARRAFGAFSKRRLVSTWFGG